MLIAGDVFESPSPGPTERRYAIQSLEPAIAAGIPILICTGNHDLPRSPSFRHALDMLREVSGVTIIDRPAVLYYARKALVNRDEDPELQLCVLPWPNISLLLADEAARKLDPGDRNLLIRERMMDVVRGLAAQLRPEVPSVLLAHCSLDVATVGDRLMLQGADWTLNASELGDLGFPYVALGHIHKPQRIEHGGESPMWYSGSPEACTFGEEGEAKGYNLVEITAEGGCATEQIPTPYRRFLTVERDFGEPGQPVLADVEGAIVRIRIPEAAAAQATDIRRQIEAAGALEVTVEIERAEAQRRAGATEMSHGMGVEDALRTWLAQHPDLETLADDLVAEGLAVARAADGDEGERGSHR
jgi:exonuclease SbcD